MEDWKEYPGDRLIKKHDAGFYVIKPKECDLDRQPIFCPLCESIMNGVYAPDAWKKFKCCDSCAGTWAYPNKEQWEKGWRPTAEQIKNKSEKLLFNSQERL